MGRHVRRGQERRHENELLSFECPWIKLNWRHRFIPSGFSVDVFRLLDKEAELMSLDMFCSVACVKAVSKCRLKASQTFAESHPLSLSMRWRKVSHHKEQFPRIKSKGQDWKMEGRNVVIIYNNILKYICIYIYYIQFSHFFGLI